MQYSDIDPRVLDLLKTKKRSSDSSANLYAALAKASAAAGSMGGVTADTSAVDSWAENENRRQASDSAADMDRRVRVAGYLDKLKQMRQQKSDAEANYARKRQDDIKDRNYLADRADEVYTRSRKDKIADRADALADHKAKLSNANEAAIARKEAEIESPILATSRVKSEKPMNDAQQKARNAFSVGLVAEDQYQNAVKKGRKSGNWDPTSRVDWMDNSSLWPNEIRSNESIEGRAAMDAWVETFLRKESGAAIPTDERRNYYPTWFPVMGDSPQTIANKKILRDQKVEQMRLAAGLGTDIYQKFAGINKTLESPTSSGTALASEAKGEKPVENGKKEIKREFSPRRNKFRITYSDGSTELIDRGGYE